MINILNIQKLEIFNGIDALELESLLNETEYTFIPAGQVIFTENQSGDDFYVLIEGSIKISKILGNDDEETVIAIRKAGDVFGEMALIDEKPRSATVTAVFNSHLLRFRKNEFSRLMSCYPQFFINIIKILTHRLRESGEIQVKKLLAQNKKLKDTIQQKNTYIQSLEKEMRDIRNKKRQ